ncbi:MAG: 5'-nucleotidase C-terminal domain-containing protein [Methanomassiliicoccales archaeon]|nr:5'-nucleotidase C-terminal domain-containing protein [Methanomassiliicoccales archaeon]
MGGTRKLTIIHANDLHGDFFSEIDTSGKSVGGLALLSAYLNKVRREEENVLFLIAGDMVQGNLIDSEYKGNANLYIKPMNKRLMQPFCILKKAGFDILVTGIITEKVMDSIKGDSLLSSFVSLEEASQEVGRITNAYKGDDIDLTILLTHIGMDSDRELARMLRPEWGVDMIVGGHSHTYITEPLVENGVIIVTAGEGTNQVGRLDVVIDDDTNSIIEHRWQLVRIDDAMVQPDQDLETYIRTYQKRVDDKYSAMISRLMFKHTHPLREVETSMGDLFADALAEMTESDVMLLASGSIRIKELGPIVTLRDVATCFPYNEPLFRYLVTGAQLRRMFASFMRKENRNGEGECYQVNSRARACYDERQGRLTSLTMDGKEVQDDQRFMVCLQAYHAKNSKRYLDVSGEELHALRAKVVATGAREVLEEWLRNNQNVGREVEGRLQYL